jgi:hypothetical protein
MNTEDKTVTNEIKLKPKGKLFRSKPRWSLAAATPFLAIIAIYSSGHDVLFLLTAVIAGLVTFLLISAWLWFARSVTLGENYVKVRNGWRVYTFTPSSELNALRVTGTSPALFLKQANQKAMINTLDNEQIELVIKRLRVTPEEATIGINGMIDKEEISETNRDILPFWIKNPVTVGIVIGFIIIVAVIIGVVTYASL